jgi:hypothetical protein
MEQRLFRAVGGDDEVPKVTLMVVEAMSVTLKKV